MLIIEPVEDLSGEHRPIKKFFANYLALTKIIYKSDIGKPNIQNININYNRKLVIVKFKTYKSNENFLSKFIKISVIGNWKVNCRLPRSQAITYRVIGAD